MDLPTDTEVENYIRELLAAQPQDAPMVVAVLNEKVMEKFNDPSVFWFEAYHNVWKVPTGLFEVEYRINGRLFIITKDETGYIFKEVC